MRTTTCSAPTRSPGCKPVAAFIPADHPDRVSGRCTSKANTDATPSSVGNDEFRIVDIGSLNGTDVNREPVASAVLANGDEIQIGKFRLVFLTRPTTS